MEFLKRHYEKLILAALLLLFIGSMVYLVQIVQSTKAITREGLKLPTRAPDFEATMAPKADDPQFNISTQLAQGWDWKPSTPRNPKYKDFSSDLVVTFAAARCAHCKRIIPLYFFDNRKCPIPDCGKELLPAPKDQGPMLIRGRGTVEDPDGCGIPHTVKEQYGLSTTDPNNVLDDLDFDGFSNLYEYNQKTRLNDGRSHPPMWHRLVLARIDKIKLPYMLMKVNPNGSDDKAKWDIQINRTDTNKSMFTSLNDVVKIDGRDYTVAEVSLKHENRKVGGSDVVDDKSVVVLRPLGGGAGMIEMQVGREVFSPDPKAFLIDVGDFDRNTGISRELVLDVGADFSLGNRRTGISRYRVKAIDQKQNQVLLIDRTRGRNYNKDVAEPVTLEGKIPQNERVRLRGVGEDPGMGMEMMP